TLSRSIFHQLRAKYGSKIAIIPQVRWLDGGEAQKKGAAEPGDFPAIPKPRLGYIGLVSNRLNFQFLHELLRAHPAWHFVHFGESKCLPLENVHAIPWTDSVSLQNVLENLDVGLMPYNCYSNKDFHCMPLKVFDYFNAGIPVVSTPIVNLWEYSNTIYFGDTAEELALATERALGEPADSPRKSLRRDIAKRQSIFALAGSLSRILFLGQSGPSDTVDEGARFESVGLRDE
ncbi:MAG TPA: glycosyltransferase, partial [Terriglobales bacterium]|nr:glycosyltransferase [Terriglobales bacterium]